MIINLDVTTTIISLDLQFTSNKSILCYQGNNTTWVITICNILNKEKVGFIGIGNMGGHMATNLIKSGHSLIVHDKDSSAVDKMVAMGATAAANPAAVATETSTIITMLPSR